MQYLAIKENEICRETDELGKHSKQGERKRNVCSPSCANPNLNCIQEYMLTGVSMDIT